MKLNRPVRWQERKEKEEKEKLKVKKKSTCWEISEVKTCERGKSSVAAAVSLATSK